MLSIAFGFTSYGKSVIARCTFCSAYEYNFINSQLTSEIEDPGPEEATTVNVGRSPAVRVVGPPGEERKGEGTGHADEQEVDPQRHSLCDTAGQDCH